MKPWEVKDTVKRFQKMSREETLKMGFELTEFAVCILSFASGVMKVLERLFLKIIDIGENFR